MSNCLSMARVCSSTSVIQLYSEFVTLATILHGACVFLHLSDTLYSGFVALAPILHGACVFLYSVMCRFSLSLHAAGRSLQGSRSLSQSPLKLLTRQQVFSNPSTLAETRYRARTREARVKLKSLQGSRSLSQSPLKLLTRSRYLNESYVCNGFSIKILQAIPIKL